MRYWINKDSDDGSEGDIEYFLQNTSELDNNKEGDSDNLCFGRSLYFIIKVLYTLL